MSIASVTANWIEKGPGVSRYNLTITIQEGINCSTGVSIPPEGLCPMYPFVYIHDMDFAEQSRICAQYCRQRLLEPELTSFAETLQQRNSYFKIS